MKPNLSQNRHASANEGARGRSSVATVRSEEVAFIIVLKTVERVEALEAAPQNLFIRQPFFRPTFEHSVDPDRFDTLKSRIVEVGVMYHLANFRDRLVRNRKALCERFERAVIAMM